MRAELTNYFKPEFINRLDDIVRFNALSREQVSEIVDLQLQNVVERVAERGVQLEITPAARELLGNMGYDPTYGARPLRRVIQKQLIDKLALALLEGRFHTGESVLADARDGQIVVESVSGIAATAS
jgi:ATP-dependent Clp protease ATP-binding subunit ClpB